MATLPHWRALRLPQRAISLREDAPPHTRDFGPLVGLLLCCLSAGVVVRAVLWLVAW
jgi:hypothetical protein